MYKIILKILFYLIVIIISISLIPYFTTPVYDFPERAPFNGNKLYNPYAGIDNGKWLKANFHAHSLAWGGFTNGRDNIVNEMKDRYKSLGYDIISISDYMKINTILNGEGNYIPVYEHGFGFTKNHQLVIGAKNVNWTEYPYFQNIDHKQKTLSEIKTNDNIIVINHPHLRGAYCSDDFKKLTDFDCIEIVNQNYGCAFDYWDEALSSGYPAFCVADDDSHNSTNFCDIGRSFTLINTDSIFTQKDVLNSLKRGKSIAVDLNTKHQSYENLCDRYASIPSLESFTVSDSSFTIKLSKKTETIVFTGQNGEIKNLITNADVASYIFLSSDTYIRTSLICSDSSKLFLNPVIRYTGSQLPLYSAVINESATLTFRLLYSSLFLTLAVGVIYYKRRKYKKGVPVVSPAEY